MGTIRANQRVEVPLYPWDRQVGEAERWYNGFLVYRDLLDDPNVASRTVTLAARRLGFGPNTETTVERWSQRWQWQARAVAWDNWHRQRREAARRKQQDEVLERHQQQATALLAVAIRLISPPPRLPEEKRREWQPKPVALQAATGAIREAQRMQRLNLGLPTEHTRQDVTMRQAMGEALEGQKLLAAVVQEHICDDCRARVRDEWERIKAHHRAIEASL